MKNNILQISRLYTYSIIYLIAIFFSQMQCFAFDLLTKQEIEIIKNIKNFDNQQQLDYAIKTAKNNNFQEVEQALTFMKYKNNLSTKFEDTSSFYQKIANWPISSELILPIENNISHSSPEGMIKWFNKHPPKTLDATKRYLSALLQNDNKSTKSNKLIKAIFVKSNFTKEQREQFLKKYPGVIKHHDIVDRVNYLLATNNIKAAESELKFLSKKEQSIFQTRIAIISKNISPDKLLPKIQPDSLSDEKLLYDIIKYYDAHDEIMKMQLYFAKVKMPIKNYQNWWGLKSRVIRSLLQHKYYSFAYKLTSSNQSSNIAEKIDAEWLSGWISLCFRKKNDDAIKHFLKMSVLAKMPVSKSRAYYWLGRSYLAKKNYQAASNAFKNAAKYPHTFYGQLACYNIAKNNKITVSESKVEIKNQHYEQLSKNKFAKLALIFSYTQNHNYVNAFIKKAISNMSSAEVMYLFAQEGSKLGKKDFAVQVAKDASLNKVMLNKFNYPLINIPNSNKVSIEFIHALIRQESLFSNSGRVSNAGAMGLMQIMPATGNIVAKILGLKFDKTKLLHDNDYNLNLGVTFLNRLYDEFDGNYILIAAAYNAGGSNVKKWIKRFGDPREMSNLNMVIDWVELIPFEETRNYVMRILETKQIYNMILSKEQKKYISNLEKDLYKNG